MGKEIRNVFFGEFCCIQVSNNIKYLYDSMTGVPEPINTGKHTGTIQLLDPAFDLEIEIRFLNLVMPCGHVPHLTHGDPVQVTQWSDGTVTIERFNEN